MAGGSRIQIDDQGITIIDWWENFISNLDNINLRVDSKLELKFHRFLSSMILKPLPIKWDFYDLFYEADFSNVQYKLINNKK